METHLTFSAVSCCLGDKISLEGDSVVEVWRDPLRATARVLIVVALVFWFWFGVGSLCATADPLDWRTYVVALGGLCLPSALVAWRWEGIGGALLALEGIVALGFVVDAHIWRRLTNLTLIVICLTLVLPLLAAGILLLFYWRGSRRLRMVWGVRSSDGPIQET
jgi:hypothetical protein